MGIWIPELVDYFNSRLPGILVDNKPVSVFYSRPDIATEPDLTARLPEINFKVYNVLPDKNRYRSDIILVSTDQNGIVYTKKPPEPYELYFQFVLSSAFMDDMIQMESQMTSMFPPRGNILVTDPLLNNNIPLTLSDNDADYDLDMFLIDYRSMDFELMNTVRQGQVPMRLFRRMYRYQVKCEQDIYPWVSTNAPRPVKGAIPNIDKKFSPPSGGEPV